MRVASWGLAALFAALWGFWVLSCPAEEVAAQFPPAPQSLERAVADGCLIALSTTVEGGWQQVTVIDAQSRSMAVYHVDPSTGSIALKCVRNIGADLEIDDLNGESPSPAEIRALLQQR